MAEIEVLKKTKQINKKKVPKLKFQYIDGVWRKPLTLEELREENTKFLELLTKKDEKIALLERVAKHLRWELDHEQDKLDRLVDWNEPGSEFIKELNKLMDSSYYNND